MPIVTDNEVTRLEKRQRGLQRVASAINDLTIYGIYPTNFPKLVGALEHSKDHIKAEIQATKKRIIELGGDTVEEVFTDTGYKLNKFTQSEDVYIPEKVVVANPLEIPDHDEWTEFYKVDRSSRDSCY